MTEAMVRAVRISAVCLLLAGVGSSCDGNVAGEPDAWAAGAGGGGALSGGGGGAGALDSSADADGPVGACAAEQAALIAFVKANKGCTADPDCVFVSAESGIQELCPSQYIQAGGFYLNASHPKAEFEKLASALDACLPPLLQCNLSLARAVRGRPERQDPMPLRPRWRVRMHEVRVWALRVCLPGFAGAPRRPLRAEGRVLGHAEVRSGVVRLPVQRDPR
jgi:hypothetical protein